MRVLVAQPFRMAESEAHFIAGETGGLVVEGRSESRGEGEPGEGGRSKRAAAMELSGVES